MTIYLRNIHNVVKTYGRQAGKRLALKRPKDAIDKVTISEEGRNLVSQLARKLKQPKELKQQKETESLENEGRKLKFKILNVENGEERVEEITFEEQAELLERVVAKIMQAKGERER